MPIGMVGEACLPSNANYPRTPDYTLYSGVHVCSSEHSDSSFVYGFMSLDFGLGTMTTTTSKIQSILNGKNCSPMGVNSFLLDWLPFQKTLCVQEGRWCAEK